jgi:hypothetical protein
VCISSLWDWTEPFTIAIAQKKLLIQKNGKFMRRLIYARSQLPEMLLVFNDASDVVYVPHLDPDTIYGCFHQSVPSPMKSVLFAAEQKCYPGHLQALLPNAKKKCASFPRLGSSYCYINVGNWAAMRDSAVNLLEIWVDRLENDRTAWDDQHIVSEMYVARKVVPIVFDAKHLFFQTTQFIVLDERKKRSFKNLTQTHVFKDKISPSVKVEK